MQEEKEKMLRNNRKDNGESETVKAIGTYTEAWSSRVINTLLEEFQNGQALMPVGFRMKGINMMDKGNGSLVVGFVIARENV